MKDNLTAQQHFDDAIGDNDATTAWHITHAVAVATLHANGARPNRRNVIFVHRG